MLKSRCDSHPDFFGMPSRELSSPKGRVVMYRLSADARIELGKNAEAVMQRTQSSAEQFQATHLSGKAATLNVTPALGMFMICSEDRDWLDLLPEKFGSFQRGKVAADTMESPFDALA